MSGVSDEGYIRAGVRWRGGVGPRERPPTSTRSRWSGRAAGSPV